MGRAYRMVPRFRREGPLQLDPVWREARELGVENEHGSMLNPGWDRAPMPSPIQGTWAQTQDHYFRYHSSRELQNAWNRPQPGDADHLELSPEPFQRDIGNCLMDTPDCNCRSILLDSFQNPSDSGLLSCDPREGDLALLPSTNRPAGYVCAGRDPHKHIRITSASLLGFVTPLIPNSLEGSNRTFFEPEQGESSETPGPVVKTRRSETMNEVGVTGSTEEELEEETQVDMMLQEDGEDSDFQDGIHVDGESVDDILRTLEHLSGQTIVPEPEPPEDQQDPNVGQVIGIDPADIATQLRRPRPGQNRMLQVDPLEAWRNVTDASMWENLERAREGDNSWEALAQLRETYSSDPREFTCPQTNPADKQDERMQDALAPELLDYDDDLGAPVNWYPKSGDVMILKSCRYNIPWPGFDGKVEFYVDENEQHYRVASTCSFEEGDVIVRFGSYDRTWRWTQAPQVRVYQYREGKHYLVARQTEQPLYPMEYTFVDPREKIPHHMDFRFKPRWGDLIINRGIRYPFVWYVYWWAEGMPVRASDLLVRTAYDEDVNLSYCDAELYLRNPNPDFPDNWIFLGKDDYCFTKPDPSMVNYDG